jgi:hypothetical protein
MRVICIANTGDKLPPKHFEPGGTNPTSRFDLAFKKEYDVDGIALWRGLLAYLIVGEGQRPAWYPSDLFEVVERKLPSNWCFAFFGQDDDVWLNAIWGYEELMSTEHYDQLTDMEPQALEMFWKRRLEIEDLPKD